jgi:hypothetical protein
MAACPGCGVVLPGSAELWNPRSRASATCHALYGEVQGYEYEHQAALGQWHQLLVDTYAAQHVGERSAAITGAFALIGLYLAHERRWSGLAVRDAHQWLANRDSTWPRFSSPSQPAPATIQDLALAGTTAEYVVALHHWSRAVWDSWGAEHASVGELIDERLPA